MHWDEIARTLNIVLGVASLVLLGRKYVKYWDRYQERTKDFWWVLTCWSLVITVGTFEVLLGWDTYFRVLFVTFAMLLTIKVLLRPNEADHPTFTNEL